MHPRRHFTARPTARVAGVTRRRGHAAVKTPTARVTGVTPRRGCSTNRTTPWIEQTPALLPPGRLPSSPPSTTSFLHFSWPNSTTIAHPHLLLPCLITEPHHHCPYILTSSLWPNPRPKTSIITTTTKFHIDHPQIKSKT
ncbi:hypothetical protein Scep_022350 [Stephania cephalantha]|uniref:Uncharacterized protein n=1 Tax=Stephania cephalantha TaxID=152367 RepID=A0AAP0F678_9MAGN